MPLRKSPTMTPRRLAANRANAQRSTGPKTPQGKARSRWNGLRNGHRSKDYQRFQDAMAFAQPGETDAVAASILSPELLDHRFIALHVKSWRKLWEDAARNTLEYRTFLREARRRLLKSVRPKPERLLKSTRVKNEPNRLLKTKELSPP